MKSERKLNIHVSTAKILAHEKDGNPIFTESKYGKGEIYFLAMPLEMNLTNTPGGFTENPAECWKIYQTIAHDIIKNNRTVTKNDPFVGITEHDLSAFEKVIVLLNFTPADRKVALTINKDWKVEKVLYGNQLSKSLVKINANDACVLLLKK